MLVLPEAAGRNRSPFFGFTGVRRGEDGPDTFPSLRGEGRLLLRLPVFTQVLLGRCPLWKGKRGSASTAPSYRLPLLGEGRRSRPKKKTDSFV